MLDKQSNKILKILKDKGEVSLSEFKDRINSDIKESLNYLVSEKYIENMKNGPAVNTGKGLEFGASNIFKIKAKGNIYLENLPKERLKYWLPIAISNIIAILSLVISLTVH